MDFEVWSLSFVAVLETGVLFGRIPRLFKTVLSFPKAISMFRVFDHVLIIDRAIPKNIYLHFTSSASRSHPQCSR